MPVAALAQGSPFDTGFNAIQSLFTGTIAKVASLVAIVIGGYGFAHGEPGAKKALAGVAAGTGIAVETFVIARRGWSTFRVFTRSTRALHQLFLCPHASLQSSNGSIDPGYSVPGCDGRRRRACDASRPIPILRAFADSTRTPFSDQIFFECSIIRSSGIMPHSRGRIGSGLT
jgi:hypothetical protein